MKKILLEIVIILCFLTFCVYVIKYFVYKKHIDNFLSFTNNNIEKCTIKKTIIKPPKILSEFADVEDVNDFTNKLASIIRQHYTKVTIMTPDLPSKYEIIMKETNTEWHIYFAQSSNKTNPGVIDWHIMVRHEMTEGGTIRLDKQGVNMILNLIDEYF